MDIHQHARCWAEIDLAALERNLHKIRAALPNRIRYVAVVKADAYGHGLAQTATRLMQCGADMFAVANVTGLLARLLESNGDARSVDDVLRLLTA